MPSGLTHLKQQCRATLEEDRGTEIKVPEKVFEHLIYECHYIYISLENKPSGICKQSTKTNKKKQQQICTMHKYFYGFMILNLVSIKSNPTSKLKTRDATGRFHTIYQKQHKLFGLVLKMFE